MTNIEWTEKTWNPIVGCSIVSPGCTNCYAMKMAARLEAMGVAHYIGTTQPSKVGPVWTGKIARAPEHILTEPLRRKKPTMYFVNSMADLFHDDVPDEWIDQVFAVMALTPQHTYQVLTKRAARMRAYLTNTMRARIVLTLAENMRYQHAPDPDTNRRAWTAFHDRVARQLAWTKIGGAASDMFFRDEPGRDYPSWVNWPLHNVWLGVSTERQKEADERIPDLLATPAAVRFISAEPLLGPVDLDQVKYTHAPGFFGSALRWHHRGNCHVQDGLMYPTLDWVIVGGESGPGARPMHPDWARTIRDQCERHGVSFFFKQWGEWLVGDRQQPRDDLSFRPEVVFQDGSDFAVVSDGHDIILGAAEDETAGPKHLWREYWGWQHHLIKRAGKGRAGRLLDGREWNDMPATACGNAARSRPASRDSAPRPEGDQPVRSQS